MKTPKRIAYCSCGCWLNLESGDYMDDKGKFHKCTTLFCPKCGAEYRGEAFAARIIRKNREARLRLKIALLTKELERQKQIAKWQHQKDRERYEESHQAWYELKRKYQELKKQKKGS